MVRDGARLLRRADVSVSVVHVRRRATDHFVDSMICVNDDIQSILKLTLSTMVRKFIERS